MRIELPEKGLVPLIFFMIVTCIIGAAAWSTNMVPRLWDITEMNRVRVPATMQARAVMTERVSVSSGRRSRPLARVQASATFDHAGQSHMTSRVGSGDNLIPMGVWKRWDAQQAGGDLRVEVSLRKNDAATAYIAPAGIEDGQISAWVGLAAITVVGGVSVLGVLSNALYLLTSRR
jgi:hypothetical protein